MCCYLNIHFQGQRVKCLTHTQLFSGREDWTPYCCVAMICKQNSPNRILKVACHSVLGSYEERTQFSIRAGYSTLMKPGRCPQRLSLRRHRHQSMYGFACLLVTASHPPAPMSDSSWGLFNLSIPRNDLTPLLTGTTLRQRSVSHITPHHVSLSCDVFGAQKAFTVGSSVLRHTSLADKYRRWRENTASVFRTKCPSESWSASARTHATESRT